MIHKTTIVPFLMVLILVLIRCSEIDNPVAIQEAHFEAAGLVLYEDGIPFFRVYQGGIVSDQDTLFVQSGGLSPEWHIMFLDEDGDELDPPSDPDKCLGWDIADSLIVQVIVDHPEEWAFQLEGRGIGASDLEIQILHESHPDFRTPRIPVLVR